jgi:hypothetical protein
MTLGEPVVRTLNWLLTGSCSLVSIVIAVPKSERIQADEVFFATGLLAFLLSPAIAAAVLTIKHTQFRYWGISYLVGWMIPFTVLVLLVGLIFSRTR